ncbi:MAG: hypothetical protein FJ225_10045 [Lentisphaerae bacterium]|nr:hypothetical protein [Lentisphaerota bacterium]
MLRKTSVVAMAALVMVMGQLAARASCGSCAGDTAADKQGEASCKAGDTVYACLTCSVVNTKAGKCAKCGADMKAMRVLAVKDGKASLCPCEAGCKCTVKADDPKQCSCGKPVTTLDCPAASVAPKEPEAEQPAKPDAEKAKPKDHPAH